MCDACSTPSGPGTREGVDASAADAKACDLTRQHSGEPFATRPATQMHFPGASAEAACLELVAGSWEVQLHFYLPWYLL